MCLNNRPLTRLHAMTFCVRHMPDISRSGTTRHLRGLRDCCGLGRGNGASVLRIVPYAAFHFSAYERYRSLLARGLYGDEAAHHHIPPVLDLLAGSAAGGTAVLMTYPLDLVRTRLAYGAERTPQRSASGAKTLSHDTDDPLTRAAAKERKKCTRSIRVGSESLTPALVLCLVTDLRAGLMPATTILFLACRHVVSKSNWGHGPRSMNATHVLR